MLSRVEVNFGVPTLAGTNHPRGDNPLPPSPYLSGEMGEISPLWGGKGGAEIHFLSRKIGKPAPEKQVGT